MHSIMCLRNFMACIMIRGWPECQYIYICNIYIYIYIGIYSYIYIYIHIIYHRFVCVNIYHSNAICFDLTCHFMLRDAHIHKWYQDSS